MDKKYDFNDLCEIMKTLLGENGCPWDKKQNHDTLKQYIIEECYEAVEAINNKDYDNLAEELGDILLQVVFNSELADMNGKFDIYDVINGICLKMIRRHPHVFSDVKADTEEKVLKNWEEIKREEKKPKNAVCCLKEVPKSLPALIRAQKVQAKASEYGFDFENIEEIFKKLDEEKKELIESYKSGKKGDIFAEFGDLLFTAVNISRFLSINSELALTNATEKFINRFEYIETAAFVAKKTFKQMSLYEMNVLWNESKSQK